MRTSPFPGLLFGLLVLVAVASVVVALAAGGSGSAAAPPAPSPASAPVPQVVIQPSDDDGMRGADGGPRGFRDGGFDDGRR